MLPSLTFFVLASCTDPGVITSENIDQYNRQYRPDGILYQPRTCATCNLLKPARSKHCRVCNRCVHWARGALSGYERVDCEKVVRLQEPSGLSLQLACALHSTACWACHPAVRST